MTGERSNYVELLEAEVRRLQAEVVRLTSRQDAGETAIIAELVAACEAAELVIPRDRRVTLEAIRSAISKAGGS